MTDELHDTKREYVTCQVSLVPIKDIILHSNGDKRKYQLVCPDDATVQEVFQITKMLITLTSDRSMSSFDVDGFVRDQGLERFLCEVAT